MLYLRQAAKDELSFGDTISFVKLYRKRGNQLTSGQQYFVVSLHTYVNCLGVLQDTRNNATTA